MAFKAHRAFQVRADLSHWPVRRNLWATDVEYIRDLGKGSYGVVYLVRKKSTGEQVALKQLTDPSIFANEQMATLVESEVYLLERVSRTGHCHPNIACVYDHYLAPGLRDATRVFPTIEMQYIDGPNLFDWLYVYWGVHNGPPGPKVMQSLMTSAAAGLVFLHRNGIVHRDIKPLNMVVVNPTSDTPTCVLFDFGTACSVHRAERHQQYSCERAPLAGTNYYQSPQVLQQYDAYRQGHGFLPIDDRTRLADDAWAFGVSFYQVATRRVLLDPAVVQDPRVSLVRQLQAAGHPRVAYPPDPTINEVILRLMQWDLRQRLTMEQAYARLVAEPK